MSKIDRANELLGRYCAGGYSSGLLGEANAKWLEDNFPGLVRVYDIYRLGPTACLLDGADEDEPRLDELLEVLENLEDYPVIDENYLSDLIAEAEHKCVEDYAFDWEIPAEFIWNAVYELQSYFEWEQDYAYYVGDLEELKAKAFELGQTWSAHYNSEMSHLPEVCGYCAEAKEVA